MLSANSPMIFGMTLPTASVVMANVKNMRQVSQRIRLALRWTLVSFPVIRFPLVDFTLRGNRLHSKRPCPDGGVGGPLRNRAGVGAALMQTYSKRLHKRLMSPRESYNTGLEGGR